MTTKTDITQERAAFEAWAENKGAPLHKVTPCDESDPYYADGWGAAAWSAWQARAAVEADRHRRMSSAPQDLLDMLDTLCTGLEWNIENHPAIMNESDSEALTEARALLSRHSSDRPAEVRCNHCGWLGADVDLVRDVAADEPEDGAADVCPQCKRIGDLQDIGLPAASAEPDFIRAIRELTSHLADVLPDDAWDQIDVKKWNDLTRHVGIAELAERRAKAAPIAQEPPLTPDEARWAARNAELMNGPSDRAQPAHYAMAGALAYAAKLAAPVAQEPVTEVLSNRKGNDTSTIDKALPDGTKLYAAPVAAQAQPSGDVDGLTAVYDAFGIGSAARTHETLLANIENAIRRSRCLSAIERVLTVETPPDPDEGDDEPGEECLLRWGADPEGYAEHFQAALKKFGYTLAPAAAQAQPTMPALTDAMRAVLRNEHCVYDSEDALYAALFDAAQAQPDVSLTPVMQRESQRGAESGRDRDDAKCWPQCWCATCRPLTMSDSRMIVCPDCGDKRCPRAHDHRNACAARAAKGADHG